MTAQGVTLTWFGHACFRVTDTAGHTVVLDPYHPQVMGQALRGLTADLLLITHEHQDHNYLDAVHARRVIHGLTEARDGAVVTLTDAPSGIAVTLVPTFTTPRRARRAGATSVSSGSRAGSPSATPATWGDCPTPRRWRPLATPTCSSFRWAGTSPSTCMRHAPSSPSWPRA